MVNCIHYVMSRIITFSDDSAHEAIGSLQNPPTVLLSQRTISARLLNRQIKGAMNLLLQELTRDLLEGLNWEVRRKTRESWALCFCANLILCMCVEQLQVAIDALVIYKISCEGRDPALTHKSGIEICRGLGCVQGVSPPLFWVS